MREIQIISLVCIVMTAVLADLKTGRIPNGIIATGLLWGGAYQLVSGGFFGALIFLGGVLLPLILFGIFYYFRMIGAGDIKLFCVTGGFLGPAACFSCITAAVLFGGVISLGLMLYRHRLVQRLLTFSDYMSHYSKERQWKSYLAETAEEDRFCFSVPVLLGVLYYLQGLGGGVI